MEALASGWSGVTSIDSGRVLEFISDEVNGWVVEPDELATASAFSRLLEDKEFYAKLSKSAMLQGHTAGWEQIITQLTSGVS